VGATSKAPRWVVAYKYETEQQPTILNDVDWQVGKGGSLTPVGRLTPVFIGGVTVTNVTLHNIDQIEKLDIHVGDTVAVERAGEVIPHVTAVIREKRPSDAKPVKAPNRCPACDEKTEWEQYPDDEIAYRCLNPSCEKYFERKIVKRAHAPKACRHCSGAVEYLEHGIELYCVNPDCPAQLKERLRWFCGRGQMDIQGLGDALIDQVVENQIVSTYSDLFCLRSERIAELTHETTLGAKKAEEIVNNISKARQKWPGLKDRAEDHRRKTNDSRAHLEWLRARAQLDIRDLGPKTIEQLVGSGLVRSGDDLFKLTAEKLAALPRQVKVGEENARKIIKSAQDAKSRGLSRVLAALGIRRVGSSAAQEYARWAGDIDRLIDATVNELAAVLMKGKAREFAEDLYKSMHSRKQKDLFVSDSGEGTTEAYLKAHNSKLHAKDRLDSKAIRAIAESFPTVTDLATADADSLLQCIVQGKAVAESLYEFLHSKHGTEIIKSLRREGLKLTEEYVRPTQSEWTGKTVVITGSFDGHSREKIKERLVSLGAKPSDSVSAKTDLVLVGAEPGSKYDKAVVLGVKVEGAETVRRLMEG